MAYLIRGREIGANNDVCVFALLGGAVAMLAFASLCAPKPGPPAHTDELRSYQVKTGKVGCAQTPASITTPSDRAPVDLAALRDH